MTKIKPPLGPLIMFFIDIGREMVALHFSWFSVTVLHLLKNKTDQITSISVDFIETLPF